jgi:hypothetical protein
MGNAGSNDRSESERSRRSGMEIEIVLKHRLTLRDVVRLDALLRQHQSHLLHVARPALMRPADGFSPHRASPDLVAPNIESQRPEKTRFYFELTVSDLFIDEDEDRGLASVGIKRKMDRVSKSPSRDHPA